MRECPSCGTIFLSCRRCTDLQLSIILSLHRNSLQIRNPMQNLDTFWREYTAFEQNNTNKELVRGLIAENQSKNIDARTEFRARRSRREGLTLTALPVPPRGRQKESSQAQQWRRFIAHERSNPFTLSVPELQGRVIHAYECALAPLYRYPDIWIEYLSYVFHTSVKDSQAASAKTGNKDATPNAKEDSSLKKTVAALEPLLERAIKALPESVGLHVHINWLYTRIAAPAKGVAALDALARAHPSPLAYIQLMRATRKADGRDLARKVFTRARKDPKGSDPTVYVAAALMEFTVNRDNKVARNVFEFGLKQNPKSAVMATEYVDWLWGLGDLEYARVILKKVMPDVKGSSEHVQKLWERWIELEEAIGDSASVDQVEEMWQESDSGKVNNAAQDVARRSRFLSFEGFTENELSSIEGVRTAVNEKNAGCGAAVSGKRDPRTGKRVMSSMAGKDGNVAFNAASRRGGDGFAQGNVLRQATEWLHRLAAAFPNIEVPAPAPDVLFRMILETPEAFSDTPAGAADKTANQGKANSDPITGKKRKGEEVVVSGEIPIGGDNNGDAPTQDVFQARQAAKQCRLR